MVQIKIERTPSGATQIDIIAEKTDTLQTLQRDQIRLHHTLDEAGIPAAGRTVTFHVAQPVHAMPATAVSGQGSGQHPPGRSTNNGATDPEGSTGSGRGGHPIREANRRSSGRPANGSAASAGTQPSTDMRSYRVGLDITA